MLAKRIIPCLDVKDGNVVKGIQFKNHQIVGDIVSLANAYCAAGADELVFYDITASCENRTVDRDWIQKVARHLTIPFCVAGGIRTLIDAEAILNAGADKISINSPALQNPDLINQLADVFGSQCIVIGVDSLMVNGEYKVCQYTGDSKKLITTERKTTDWVSEIEERGAGEIVLNCMNHDGVRNGYDITQLSLIRALTHLPLVASGGAGSLEHFLSVFNEAKVDAALAASVFHSGSINISELKRFLINNQIEMRNEF